jgi:hypothetical protein
MFMGKGKQNPLFAHEIFGGMGKYGDIYCLTHGFYELHG